MSHCLPGSITWMSATQAARRKFVQLIASWLKAFAVWPLHLQGLKSHTEVNLEFAHSSQKTLPQTAEFGAVILIVNKHFPV